jgi:choice-of-anchor C domain-containing protein
MMPGRLQTKFVAMALGMATIVTNTMAPSFGKAKPVATGVRNLVTNGTFDAKVTDKWREFEAGSGEISGWKVIRGSVDVVSNKYWQTPDGPTALDLNGDRPGAIEQIISTRPNCRYSVSFSYTANPDGRRGATQTFMVIAGKDHAEFDVLIAPDQSSQAMHWQTGHFTFEATAAKTALQFSSFTRGYYGGCIDNVVVVPAAAGAAPDHAQAAKNVKADSPSPRL